MMLKLLVGWENAWPATFPDHRASLGNLPVSHGIWNSNWQSLPNSLLVESDVCSKKWNGQYQGIHGSHMGPGHDPVS